MGTLSIEVPEGANAAIYKSGLDGERVGSSNATGEQKFRLKKGEYTVVLTKDFNASKSSVSLGFREKETVALALVESADLYQLSKATAKSVGVAGTAPAYTDSSLGDIRDNNGKPIGKSVNYLAHTAIFADDGSNQLLIENDGSGYVLRGGQSFAVFGESGNDESGSSFSIESFGAIVAAAYDTKLGRYCVLSTKLRLGWVDATSGTLTDAGYLKEGVSADYIDCHNTVIAYARLNQDYDAETRPKEKNVKVHALINGETVQLAEGEITAFQLLSDGFVFVEKGAVKERLLSDANTRIVFSTDNTATTALLVGNNQLYVIDTSEAWQLNADLSSASRKVTSPNLAGASSVAVLNDGNLVFSVTRGVKTGVFVTSSDPHIKEVSASLALKLPYATASFSVSQQFNGQKFVLKVTNLAPIPSNGSMGQYDAADQAAHTFITGLAIDPALVEVSYE